MEGSQADLNLKALEDFLVGNRDLERPEALLDRFNILEALGVVRQELRHSDFLAYLMDPRDNHGLGDTFVKRLLQRVLMAAGDVPGSSGALAATTMMRSRDLDFRRSLMRLMHLGARKLRSR